MVEIRSFRALRYAPSVTRSISEVVAPPYDVVGAAELGRLWERNPHNAVRLILPAGDLSPSQQEQGYRLASQRLRAWKEAGLLVPDSQPSLYLYQQHFRLPTGQAMTRHGFFGLARLTPWGQGIYRHELTLPGPVSDRIRLLEACQANLSGVFGLYSDPRHEVISTLAERVGGRPPAVEAVDDLGVWHGLWQVSDPRAVRRVAGLLRERPVVVADGHHRYTAALACQRRRRADHSPVDQGPWDYTLFYLGAFEAPGLVILPTHQVLHGLHGFAAERFPAEMRTHFAVHQEPALASLLEKLDRLEGAPGVVLGAVVEGSRYYLLEADRPSSPVAPEEGLDVSVLRRRAVEPLLRRLGAGAGLEQHLRYTHDVSAAAAQVSAGEANVAFILRPTPLAQVRSVALAGRVMPQKSTYFHPKLLSGLVFFDHALWEPEPQPLVEHAGPAR